MIYTFKMLWRRFLEGNSSLVERLAFFKLILSGRHDRFLENNFMKELHDEMHLHQQEAIPIPERIFRNIARPQNAPQPRLQPATTGTRQLYRWMLVAAAITFALAAAVWAVMDDAKAQPPNASLLVIQGPTRFHLQDGTKGVLDEASTLAIDTAAYGHGCREVTLQGQAFFEVTPDRTVPFIVRSGKVSTTVLGTAFNVKAWPQKNVIRVTVNEGKVNVNDGENRSGNIEPDQQITVNTISHTLVKRNVMADTALAWMNKYLLFDNTSLAAAMKRVEEKFNITILFANENLKDIILDAGFMKEKDMELENVLGVVTMLTKTKFTVEGRVVTIRGSVRN